MEKICYEFVFYSEEGTSVVKAFWAYYETEAWRMADNYAFKHGYVDYKLVDDE